MLLWAISGHWLGLGMVSVGHRLPRIGSAWYGLASAWAGMIMGWALQGISFAWSGWAGCNLGMGCARHKLVWVCGALAIG